MAGQTALTAVLRKLTQLNQSKVNQQGRRRWCTIRINMMQRRRRVMVKFTKRKSYMRAEISISLSSASFPLESSRNGAQSIPNQDLEAEVPAHKLHRYQNIQNHSRRIRKAVNQIARRSPIWISLPEIQLIEDLQAQCLDRRATTKPCYMMRSGHWFSHNQTSKKCQRTNSTRAIRSFFLLQIPTIQEMQEMKPSPEKLKHRPIKGLLLLMTKGQSS